MNETITPQQRRKFFVMCNAAARNLGLFDKAEADAYRHQVMDEEAHVQHLGDLNRKSDFDACLQRFASDAGDFLAAIEVGLGNIKRLAFIVKVMAVQVMQLKGGSELEARAYLEGIMNQARVTCGIHADNSFYMDVSQRSLRTLLQILDTYRRKLIKANFPAGTPTKFDYSVRYVIDKPVSTRITDLPSDYYVEIPFKVNVR